MLANERLFPTTLEIEMDETKLHDLIDIMHRALDEMRLLGQRMSNLEHRVAPLDRQAVAYMDPAEEFPWAWDVVCADQWSDLVASDPSARRVGSVTTYSEARAVVALLEQRFPTGSA